MNNNKQNFQDYMNRKSYNPRSQYIKNFNDDGRDEVMITSNKNESGKLGNVIKKNYIVWIIAIPLVIGLVLWFAKPNFVLQRDENDEVIIGNIDWSKLILWTAIFSVVLYVILWILKGAF